MPTAALRPCPAPHCRQLTKGGPCPTHRRQADQLRGSRHERGYGITWEDFRQQFMDRLIEAGIVPCCGAALPTGPSMQHSQCKAQGRLNIERLNLDHDPPLQDWERADRAKVEDETRVGFLCHHCHARKTFSESRTITA